LRSRLLTLAVALTAFSALLIPPASAALRDDADWSEHYFPSSDGVTRLHADVLRPKGMPWDEQTPVILTVSPYTNHSGSLSPTEDQNGVGPNPRFYDFLDLTGALTKGYTYVMVDLPGDGGSGGCNDWGGVREQAAVYAAVEWAASQTWSTGSVGLIGKSYDGWTGLMGVATQPKGLEAVVSLEPVYSGYRYIWMNGVRRTNWPYGTSFTQVDAMPGRLSDTPEYHANGAPQAWCYPVNIAGHNLDDSETGPYWAERNLVPTSLGKTTPVFLTQGFLETNTKWDGTSQYWNGLSGDHNHAWFGQFNHVRGWEKTSDGERFQTGRSVFIDEMMRFFDEHLKGIQPEVIDPVVSVQDNLGRYRAESQWPPEDSHLYQTALNVGTYTDSGSGHGLRPNESQTMWTVSEPLAHDVWFSGEPVFTAGVDSIPNTNIAANVYDISPDGAVQMISRGVSLLRGTGPRSVSFTMYGQDWVIPAGHRVGVLISPANTDEFRYFATRQDVTVRWAKIDLPFLTYDRTEFLDGGSTPRLESYLGGNKTVLSAEQLASYEVGFTLPGPLVTPEPPPPNVE